MSKKYEKIDHEAFRRCYALEKIELPASLEELGEMAFYECSSLKTVTWSAKSKVTKISRYAFGDCTSLEKITIPNKVTNIASLAFINCSSLTSIDIPSSVIEIGNQAFDYCANLSEVKLHEGLEIIDNSAFRNTSIKKIVLPSTVTRLGLAAFENCENLRSFSSSGSNLEYIKENTFSNCINLKEIKLNEGLIEIEKYAFDQAGLTTIVIPSTVERLRSQAFSDCSNLKHAFFLGTPIMDGFDSGSKTTLYGFKNSTVHDYAKNNGMRFVAIVIPEGLKATNSNYKHVTLAWKAEGKNKYNIYRSTSKNGAYQKLDTVTTTSYKDDSIKPGKTYYYYVSIKYEDEDGVLIHDLKSNIASIKLAPKNVTGSNADYQTKSKKVKLTWDKSSDATGYVVYYRDKSTDKWTKIKGTSTNKTLSYTHKLKSNFKNREYAIRTYKTVNGKNVYSGYKIIKVSQ